MPKAYVLCDIEVTDSAAYEDYKKLSLPAVERYGGRFLVRGGATDVFEGDRQPGRIVVLEFSSPDDARRWYDSPEYREARRVRERAATGSFVLVEGAD